MGSKYNNNFSSQNISPKMKLFTDSLKLINDEIRNMVTSHASASDIKKKAVNSGMNTLFTDGIEKVKNGVVTIEEVLSVTGE